MPSFSENFFFKLFVTIIGSFLVAMSFNLFLLSHGVLSSGIGGLSLLIDLLSSFNAGTVNLFLNLPLLIIGFMKLKRSVMIHTIFSVGLLSLFLTLIPVTEVSKEPIFDVIFGGVFCGIGVGLILKYSGTTGGMDIIAMLISQHSNISIGFIMTIMNGLIVIASGFFLGWEVALMTLLSIYITGKTVDTIFTAHIKLTINIITSEGEAIRQALLKEIYRGSTVIDTQGGFSGTKHQMIMMVLTRYELQTAVKIAKEIDPKCFINVYETTEVHGNFARG